MVTTTELRKYDFRLEHTDDQSSLSLISVIRDGIEYNVFDELLKSFPFSIADWSKYLNLTERTLQRYKKEQKPFQGSYAERILEIKLLYQYGQTVFEDNENLNIWLETKSIALGNIKPKDLLDTSFGIKLLKDELTRIEHGVFA